MINKTYKIVNPTGLDAKSASVLVSNCSKFNCEVFLCHLGANVNLKSIMGVMSLNVHKGEIVEVSFSGVDEEEAYNVINQVIGEIKLGKLI